MKNIFLNLFAVLALTACGSDKSDYILEKTAFCSNTGTDEPMICTDSDGAKINGRIIGYYPNGKIHKNFIVKNGVPDGIAKTFYENGKKKQELKYVQGELNGLSKAWNMNGKIQSEHHYKNNKYDGIRKEYDENGKLHDILTYKNGKLDGERTTYSKKGTEKQIYNDGSLVSAKTYNEKGKLKSDYDGTTQKEYKYNDYGILVSTSEHQNFMEISTEKIPEEQIAAECAKFIKACQGESFKDIKKGCKTVGISGKVVTKSDKGIQIEHLPNVVIKTKANYKIGDLFEPKTYLEYITSRKYRTFNNLNNTVDVYEFKETDLPICE